MNILEAQSYYYLKVFYIGENYHGIQKQPNVSTIEGELIKALRIKRYIPMSENGKENGNKNTNGYLKQIPVHIAGRTDKGVNARGMVMAFLNYRSEFHPIEVNKELPDDIFIWAYSKIHNEKEIKGFIKDSKLTDAEKLEDILKSVKNPRYNASYRHYKYFLNVNQSELDFDKIEKATKKLIGKHEFKYLCKDPGDKKTCRTIDSIEITQYDGIWIFDFKARSFLWKQIRKFMGILIRIGQGKWEVDVIDKLLSRSEEAKKLSLYIVTADEKSLVLWDVVYPDEIQFQKCEISIEKMNDKLTEWLNRIDTRRKIINDIMESL